MTATKLAKKVEDLGLWYHRIDLGNGVVTPGDRDQSLTYNLYQGLLPEDLSGMTVLDMGANACGFSIEFAKRGAKVLAVELDQRYIDQARFVVDHFGLSDRIEIRQADLFDAPKFGEFDIVAYVGLSYHIKYPQLALDMLGWNTKSILVASTQTVPGRGLSMVNRSEKTGVAHLSGYEPTESLFIKMLSAAGFKNPRLVSTSPHKGEGGGRFCGNRSYFFADAGERMPLPFVGDDAFIGKSVLAEKWRLARS